MAQPARCCGDLQTIAKATAASVFPPPACLYRFRFEAEAVAASREPDGSRIGERAGELGEDGQVGVLGTVAFYLGLDRDD